MKEKKPFYKKWWFWVIIVFVVICYIGGSKGDDDSANADISSVESSVEVTESSENASFESLLTDQHEDWSDVATTDNGYQIQYKDTSSQWDENTFVTDGISYYVKFSNAVYEQYPDLDYVKLFIFVDVQDSKGNTSQIQGLRISMTQDEFNTFTWDNLEYFKIYDTFKASCTDFYVAPSIEQNLNSDKIYYLNK